MTCWSLMQLPPKWSTLLPPIELVVMESMPSGLSPSPRQITSKESKRSQKRSTPVGRTTSSGWTTPTNPMPKSYTLHIYYNSDLYEVSLTDTRIRRILRYSSGSFSQSKEYQFLDLATDVQEKIIEKVREHLDT